MDDFPAFQAADAEGLIVVDDVPAPAAAPASRAPSFEVIGMPYLSPTMQEGSIMSHWPIPLGKEVKAGDALCDVELDKTFVALELQDDAVIAKYLVEPDEEVPVGTPIAITIDSVDDFPAFQAADAEGRIVVDGVGPHTPVPRLQVIKMPAISPNMQEGRVDTKWFTPPGERGELHSHVETDTGVAFELHLQDGAFIATYMHKTFEAFELQDDTVIAKYLMEPDEWVPVGAPIAITIDKFNFPAFQAADAEGRIVVDGVGARIIPATTHVTSPATTHVTSPATTHVTTPATTHVTTPATAHVTTPATTHVTTPATAPAAAPTLEPAAAEEPELVSEKFMYHSPRWRTMATKSALSTKLRQDQEAYTTKFGSTGHPTT